MRANSLCNFVNRAPNPDGLLFDMIKECAVECQVTSRSAFAGVAQWQSNGFVNRRLRVRLPSPASWADVRVAKGDRL
jgi:hypothetical protein